MDIKQREKIGTTGPTFSLLTRTCLVYSSGRDVEISLGRRRDGRGRIGHEVAGLGGLGEGDHFADIVLAGEQHHDAVYAGCYAAVGRRAYSNASSKWPKRACASSLV